jgi:hypothetical protein
VTPIADTGLLVGFRDRADQFHDWASELLPDAVVYTTDKRDFTVYRRNRNQPIKLVTP